MCSARPFLVIGSSNGSTNLGDQSMWESAVDTLRAKVGPVPVVTDAMPGWQAPRPEVHILPMLHPEFKRWKGTPRSKLEAGAMLVANRDRGGRARRFANLFAQGRMGGQAAAAWYEAIDSVEAVIVSGAGGITDEFALHGVFGWSAILERAAAQGKPVALIGQGVGPIRSTNIARQAKRLLDVADLITVRDHLSADVVRSISPSSAAIVTADWAIALRVTEDDRKEATYHAQRLAGGVPFSVVSFHDRVTASRSAVDALCHALRGTVERAKARNEVVLGLANSTSIGRGDDRVFMNRLRAGLPENLRESFRVQDIEFRVPVARALFGEGKIVIASRYHPLVFALAEGTPAVGISFDEYYDQKLVGALRWYGEEDRVVRLPNELDRLLHLVNDVTSRIDRAERRASSRRLEAAVTGPLERWLSEHGLTP